jgi:hypothetical protein
MHRQRRPHRQQLLLEQQRQLVLEQLLLEQLQQQLPWVWFGI